MKRLVELEGAEIRSGNTLLVPCQVEGHCCGMLRIPFRPGIAGAPDGKPTWNGIWWERVSGESLSDLTLSPSIDADTCGHFHVVNGEIVP